jgi:hypothetical protein
VGNSKLTPPPKKKKKKKKKETADTLIWFLTELKVLQNFLGNPHSGMPENFHNVEEKMCT